MMSGAIQKERKFHFITQDPILEGNGGKRPEFG